MHRVDPKQNRARILRLVAYTITLGLTIITTIALLYIALGFRFDRHSGHVVRSGLLLVENRPENAAVYLNNVLKDQATPSRFVLGTGTYGLKLTRQGYRDWSKNVAITASGVNEVNYPLLIPKTLTSTPLSAPSGLLAFSSQSPDRKYVLTYVSGQTNFQLTELDPKEPKQTNLTISTGFTRENGQLGSFKAIEWALNSKQVLLEHTLPSGRIELISYDITKPAEAINITDLYGELTPSDLHFVGNNTELVYGLKNGVVSTYDLNQVQQTALLQNIRSYQPYGDDTVLFERTASNQQVQVGIWKDKNQTVIESATDTGTNALLKYAKYEDHYYFVVADEKTVTIYRDPLKSPILAKQLPLTTIAFEKPTAVDFGDSAQFVLVQNGKNALTYDFDYLMKATFVLPFEPLAGTKMNWINATHIATQATDGMNYLYEYDGQNMQNLVISQPGLPLYLAGNYQYGYRYYQTDGVQKLDSVSLLASKK